MDLNKAIKIKTPEPTFAIVNENILNKYHYHFKFRCSHEIAVGFCDIQEVQNYNYLFDENVRIPNCFLFKITPQNKNEIIIVKIYYDENSENLCLQNLNNNALTFIEFH